MTSFGGFNGCKGNGVLVIVLFMILNCTMMPVHGQEKRCRSAMDVILISNGQVVAEEEFSTIRAIWADLPNALQATASDSSPPDRFSWWQWDTSTITPVEARVSHELSRTFPEYSTGILDTAFSSPDGDGSPTPQPGLSHAREYFVDVGGSDVNDFFEDTRCVYVVVWDGATGSSGLAGTIDGIVEDGCMTLFWVAETVLPADRDVVLGLAQPQTDVEWRNAVGGFGSDANDFLFDVTDYSTQSSDGTALAEFLNSTAAFRAEYCDDGFYDVPEPTFSSYAFIGILFFGMCLLLVCSPFIYACVNGQGSSKAADYTLFTRVDPPAKGSNDFEGLIVDNPYAPPPRPSSSSLGGLVPYPTRGPGLFDDPADDKGAGDGNEKGLLEDGDKQGEPEVRGIRLAYFQLLIRFEASLQRGFRNLGAVLVRWPRAFMLASLVVGLVFFLGGLFYYLNPENDVVIREVGKLWAPPESLSRAAGNYLSEAFPSGAIVPRVQAGLILMDPENPGINLLQKEYLEEIRLIEEEFENQPEYAVKNNTDGEEEPTCFFIKNPDNCYRMSPLDYWRNETTGDLEPIEDDLEAIFARTFDVDESSNSTSLEDEVSDSLGSPLFRNNVFLAPLVSWDCRIWDEASEKTVIDVNCGGQWSIPEGLRDEAVVTQWNQNGNITTAFRMVYFRLPGGRRSESWDDFFVNYQTPDDFKLKVVSSGHGTFLERDVELAVSTVPWAMWIVTGGSIIAFLLGVFYKRNPVKSRMMLGMTGLFGTCLSICAGIGGLVWAGVGVSVTTIIVPVVVLSIGVDDMFLIVDAFEETSPLDPLAVRIPDALQACGLAIGMTTATDALAFAVGTLSPLPAVSDMSVFAFACVLVDFTFQLLWFVPGLVLDAAREQQGRSDSACAFMWFQGPINPGAVPLAARADAQTRKEAEKGVHPALIDELEEDELDESSHGSYFLGELLGPTVVHPVIRILIVVSFLTLAIIGFFSVGGLNVGLDIFTTLRYDSQFGSHQRYEKELFVEPVTPPVDLLHVNRFVKSGDREVPKLQGQILEMDGIHAAVQEQYLVPGSLVSWWDEFSDYFRNNNGSLPTPGNSTDPGGNSTMPGGPGGNGTLPGGGAGNTTNDNSTTPEPEVTVNRTEYDLIEPLDPGYLSLDDWDPVLADWLETPASDDGNDTFRDVFEIDFVGGLDGEEYASSKISGLLLPLTNIRWRSATFLIEFYKLLGASGWAPYSSEVVLFEPNTMVIANLIADVSYTLMIVFVVTIIFLQHPSASVLLVVALLSVVGQVLLLMNLLSIHINAFTEVTLVIAMGLSIDYISHIAHAFVSAPGGRSSKAVHALAAHGPAIFNGMATTAVGMTCLITLGHIEIIATFGSIVLIMQIVGLVHAFVFLPALMSWLGPLSFRNPVAQVLVEQNQVEAAGGFRGGLDLTTLTSEAVAIVRASDIARVDRQAASLAIEFDTLLFDEAGDEDEEEPDGGDDIGKPMIPPPIRSDPRPTRGRTASKSSARSRGSSMSMARMKNRVSRRLKRTSMRNRQSIASGAGPVETPAQVSDYRYKNFYQRKPRTRVDREGQLRWRSTSAASIAQQAAYSRPPGGKPRAVRREPPGRTGGSGGSRGSRGSRKPGNGSSRAGPSKQAGRTSPSGLNAQRRGSPGEGSQGSRRGGSGTTSNKRGPHLTPGSGGSRGSRRGNSDTVSDSKRKSSPSSSRGGSRCGNSGQAGGSKRRSRPDDGGSSGSRGSRRGRSGESGGGSIRRNPSDDKDRPKSPARSAGSGGGGRKSPARSARASKSPARAAGGSKSPARSHGSRNSASRKRRSTGSKGSKGSKGARSRRSTGSKAGKKKKKNRSKSPLETKRRDPSPRVKRV